MRSTPIASTLHRPSLLSLLSLAWAATALAQGPRPQALAPNRLSTVLPASVEACRALDQPALRNRMDGLLFNLLWSCGRQAEVKQLASLSEQELFLDSLEEAILRADTQVNNSAGENGTSTTQSETSIAYNGNTGTVCSSFNDSWEFFGSTGGGGFTGFARSLDGGVTWTDRGAVGASSGGDPSLAWRKKDGLFYLGTLNSGGSLAVWRSSDDCQNFTLLSVPSTGNDDKEILIADNNPASPNYGNLYLVWTDFGEVGTPIRAIRSTDGGSSWSAPFNVSAAGSVQGAWPAVAPNGDVFVAWLRYASFPNGNITIEVARSTNGGLSYAAVTSPLVNAVSPRDSTASTSCGRPALNGNLRYLASPQITVDSAGTLQVVYTYDPDGFNTGDVVNVYHRRSTNSGATWSAETRLNDVTTGDQYFPTIQSNGTTLVATWYDRRNDPSNLRQDYYKRVSTDGGITWGANVRLSDVNSPIQLDPNLATCYHGDYDQSVVGVVGSVSQWADDRRSTGTRNDPDVYTDDRIALPAATTNAASFSTASVAPDSAASLFGARLATTTVSAGTVPLPTNLGGTTVSVRDSLGVERAAGLFFVSPAQVNFQVPPGTATGTALVTVTSGDGTLSASSPLITNVAPGLYSANASGTGLANAQILRVKPDGTQIYEGVSNIQFIAGDTLYLILYATGVRQRTSLAAVSAAVGSTAPAVLYAGAQGSYVALDQINLGPLSTGLSHTGTANVRVTVDGSLSNTVTVIFP
ncbi:MAG: hypothetical protein U0002_14480 [Thermoanaerobaculia bacterium]